MPVPKAFGTDLIFAKADFWSSDGGVGDEVPFKPFGTMGTVGAVSEIPGCDPKFEFNHSVALLATM